MVGVIGCVIGLYLYYEFLVNGVYCNLKMVKLFKLEFLLCDELVKFKLIVDNFLV